MEVRACSGERREWGKAQVCSIEGASCDGISGTQTLREAASVSQRSDTLLQEAAGLSQGTGQAPESQLHMQHGAMVLSKQTPSELHGNGDKTHHPQVCTQQEEGWEVHTAGSPCRITQKGGLVSRMLASKWASGNKHACLKDTTEASWRVWPGTGRVPRRAIWPVCHSSLLQTSGWPLPQTSRHRVS